MQNFKYYSQLNIHLMLKFKIELKWITTVKSAESILRYLKQKVPRTSTLCYLSFWAHIVFFPLFHVPPHERLSDYSLWYGRQLGSQNHLWKCSWIDHFNKRDLDQVENTSKKAVLKESCLRLKPNASLVPYIHEVI